MRTRIHKNHLGYHLYNSLFKKAVWWKRLWKLNIMPEIKVFIWHLCRKALPTKDRLSLRGVNVKGGCYFCDHNEETLCHLFFCCPYTMNAIFQANPPCILPIVDEGTWLEDFCDWARNISANQMQKLLVVWHQVWSTRNAI